MESYEKIKKVLALGFMNFLDDNKSKGKMCLSNGECADIEKAFNEQDWPRLAGYLDKYTESEDERIRRELIEYLKGDLDDITTDDTDRWIAYLEKQKEQPISAEEVLARAGLKPYKDGNQWCILAGDNIQEGICGFGDTIEDALYEFLKEVLDLQKEQKPAWSEEDEKKIHFLSRLIEFQVKDGEYCFGEGACAISKQEAIEMLQSLRPSWKPSEEQMEELLWCTAHLGGADHRVLAELYEHLKKLM